MQNTDTDLVKNSPYPKRGENWVRVGTTKHLWIDWMDSWFVNRKKEEGRSRHKMYMGSISEAVYAPGNTTIIVRRH